MPEVAHAQPWQTSAAGAALQVMGPDDSYLLQYGKDVRSFWADPHALALGACFRPRGAGRPAAPLGRVVPEVLGTDFPDSNDKMGVRLRWHVAVDMLVAFFHQCGAECPATACGMVPEGTPKDERQPALEWCCAVKGGVCDD